MWQKIKNLYHLAQAAVAAAVFNFPSRKITVVGVTGTDGKSTTALMIYQILKFSGKKVSVVTSIGATIGSKTEDTGYHVTTPSPFALQKILRKALEAKQDHIVIEATSHGLDQNRLAFVKFKVAAITNVTNEHLDYHRNWQNYLLAKSKLFKNVEFSVLNYSDKSFGFLRNLASGKILTYGLTKEADFNPVNFPLKLNTLGDYNLENALAASAAATALGVEKRTIQNGLRKFKGVAGRMQKIDEGQEFSLYVDFAHTPNALRRALENLQKLKARGTKLVAVFGAAGERDHLKRPLMGQAAAKLADFSILTAEDPRKENVEDICNEIAQGFIKTGRKYKKNYLIIPDRKKAIEHACRIAKKGDIVVLFGKGHEKSMDFGKKEVAWDEEKIARFAIRKKAQSTA